MSEAITVLSTKNTMKRLTFDPATSPERLRESMSSEAMDVCLD